MTQEELDSLRAEAASHDAREQAKLDATEAKVLADPNSYCNRVPQTERLAVEE